jgi:hypothetical protein
MLRVQGNWRHAACCQREEMIVIEPIEDPDVPPAHTTDERASRRERGLVVTRSG